jgi:hypothetical protein
MGGSDRRPRSSHAPVGTSPALSCGEGSGYSDAKSSQMTVHNRNLFKEKVVPHKGTLGTLVDTGVDSPSWSAFTRVPCAPLLSHINMHSGVVYGGSYQGWEWHIAETDLTGASERGGVTVRAFDTYENTNVRSSCTHTYTLTRIHAHACTHARTHARTKHAHAQERSHTRTPVLFSSHIFSHTMCVSVADLLQRDQAAQQHSRGRSRASRAAHLL